jgi:glycosyltransferase involved in cell wall biosynthesis
MNECSVIVRTMARPERAAMLWRAIESIRSGNSASIEIIVVVNGEATDETLMLQLRNRPGIRVITMNSASSPGAILEGRRAVSSPYFSYLDDDDEYLPGAVDARLGLMCRQPTTDIVASNGFRRKGNVRELALKHLDSVPSDPLAALFQENWLPSCGVTFRTATVSESFFVDLPKHIHWSFLGFRLALAKKTVSTIDEPTFVINDTPGSASKTSSYLMCHVEIYSRMLDMSPPPAIRRILKQRLAQAWHEASDSLRRDGSYSAAWRAHFNSLRSTAGWKFMPYTRHLLRRKA